MDVDAHPALLGSRRGSLPSNRGSGPACPDYSTVIVPRM
jgi:hypothetical protein